jgi:hypothetical protein
MMILKCSREVVIRDVVLWGQSDEVFNAGFL